MIVVADSTITHSAAISAQVTESIRRRTPVDLVHFLVVRTMPPKTPAWAMKSTGSAGSKKGEPVASNQKGKSKGNTFKGKQKGRHTFGVKGQRKHGVAKGGKGQGKQSNPFQSNFRVSPVSRQDQPAFQTNLAGKTSRKRLTPPPPGFQAKKLRSVPVAMPMAGLPVPPSKYLGNPDRMRLRHMKSSPINLEAGNFDIHKRTVVIKGRPVQCLQVSHQKAPSYEFDGYIPFLMRPVPVQAFQGYSSFDEDKPHSSHPYEVVVNWWQVFVFL